MGMTWIFFTLYIWILHFTTFQFLKGNLKGSLDGSMGNLSSTDPDCSLLLISWINRRLSVKHWHQVKLDNWKHEHLVRKIILEINFIQIVTCNLIWRSSSEKYLRKMWTAFLRLPSLADQHNISITIFTINAEILVLPLANVYHY